jgi:hypothetical protein
LRRLGGAPNGPRRPDDACSQRRSRARTWARALECATPLPEASSFSAW